MDVKTRGPRRTGRREQAKEERRTRIVEAARELMRKVGFEELSMRQVAARADVSVATVYNLFDSKEAVLARIYAESFEHFRDIMSSRPASDALSRLFKAVDVAIDIYASDPDFYRASIWLIVGRDPGLKASIQEPRVRFWCSLVADAMESGQLRRIADPTVVGTCCVVPIIGAAYQAWCAGDTPVNEFRARAKFGIAVALKAIAAPSEQARLKEMIEELEKTLLGYVDGRAGSRAR